MAERLKRRLADLRAATSLDDLIAGRPHKLAGDRHIAIELGDDYRLVFCANHTANPILRTGEIDWSKVSRIKILRIEKYSV